MKIETGLFTRMVLQRTKDNVTDAAVTGTCKASGKVLVTVSQDGKPVRGFATKEVGTARGGSFKARISGVKAGGPYDFELAIVDKSGDAVESVAAKDVFVGDVWLLAGQSNMQGCGNAVDKHKSHPMVRNFYMDDRWAKASDPLHNMWGAVDEVHPRISGGQGAKPAKVVKGVGPGVAFAVRMHERTGVPQGTIAAAHGGTSMGQWNPKLHEETGESTLFSAAVRRVKKNGGHIAGIVWYQGESDCNADAAPRYTGRMEELIAAFRKEIGYKSGGALPVAIVQLSRVVSAGWASQFQHWNSVQEQQRKLPTIIKRLTTVPAIDLVIDDLIHIGGKDQQTLGYRLAEAMHTMLGGKGSQKPPIELGKIEIKRSPYNGQANLHVHFKNVEGKLVAHGRPVGFDFGDEELADSIFRIDVEKEHAVLWTQHSTEGLGSCTLHYGRKTDPVCNITDEAGRSLPVFGPVHIGEPKALSEFVESLRVSKPMPSAGKLAKLAYPKHFTPLALEPRDFPTRFIDVHGDYPKVDDADPLYYFACRIDCHEKMKLALCLGYDGPVKVWFDKKKVHHDPNGTNPAIEDEVKVPVTAAKGKHEVLVAFSSNNKGAWGVFLRFQRADVSKAQIAKGPGAYLMPEILG